MHDVFKKDIELVIMNSPTFITFNLLRVRYSLVFLIGHSYLLVLCCFEVAVVEVLNENMLFKLYFIDQFMLIWL